MGTGCVIYNVNDMRTQYFVFQKLATFPILKCHLFKKMVIFTDKLTHDMRSQAIRYFRMILQILHRYISLFSRTPTYTKEEKAEIVTTHHDGGVVIVRNDPNTLLWRIVPPRRLLGPV